MMENKKVLIVGATGSWGMALLERILQTGAAAVKVFARNEHNMVCLQQQFPDPRIEPILGDIRDRARLMQACQGVDILFHLAALKHVPVCEKMPTEAIATNVTGTQNIVDCAIGCGVEKVVYVSTDKAVTPHCAYGCTKLLGESLILAANEQSCHTKFLVFRCGNLLGSSGSVIPLFRRQIAQSGRVSLTDRQMNRFFIPIPQAAELLLEAAVRGAGGEVFLPQMNSLLIHHVAKYLLAKSGLDESHIAVTGIRPGEALSETMATPEEGRALYRVSELLSVYLGADRHRWVANEFVTVGEYQPDSAAAPLSYEASCEFLTAAGI